MGRNTQERYRSYFDGYRYMDEMLSGSAWKKPINSAKLNHINRIVGYPAGKRILDAGCGSGIFSVHFAKMGADVKAIDISEESIKTVREWAKKEAVWVDAEVSSIEGFRSDTMFDLILALDSLMYTDNIRPATDNLFRHLRPGGILVLEVPNLFRWASIMSAFDQYPLSGVRKIFRKLTRKGDKLPYQKHPPWVWESLLRKSGFGIDSRTGCFIFPSLKSEKADSWLWRRRGIVSASRLVEQRVSDARPFSYLGQSFILVARKPE